MMAVPKSEYLSNVWADGIFGEHPSKLPQISWSDTLTANRVLFITGGAGSICSAQTRALVHLGANACIIGRSVEKTEAAAKQIALVRPGSKVIGIGGVDVRNVSLAPAPLASHTSLLLTPNQFDLLKAAADRCVSELGAIDYVM
jgi:2,4-dienoyl-CoA reductase [(3E)-enoyl-CoA-producing], peroxisomal